MSPQVNPQVSNQAMTGSKRYISMLLSTVFMGLGQIFNRQYVKGTSFAIVFILSIFRGYDFWLKSLDGLIHMGTVPGKDHSVIILIESIAGLVLFIFFLGMYIANIIDAYRVGKLQDLGYPVPDIKKTIKNALDLGYAYLYLSPGMIFLILVTIIPLVFTCLIAFTSYDLYHSPPAKLLEWVGMKNFQKIWSFASWKRTFISVFSWTVTWTFISTFSTFGLGLFIALLLNQKDIVFKKVWRTILILPWAVPAIVSILIFAGLFNTTHGAINEILVAFQLNPVRWLEDPIWSKAAVLIVNLWLGFPFQMALATGILQAIPQDIYEAAKVDGASPVQTFFKITLPLVLYSMGPLIIMNMAYNFNNFNVIYLFNQGKPPILGLKDAGGTDILISWVYKLTLDRLKYNYAAALSIIIFIIVAGFAIYNFRRTRSFQEEDMLQ